jgi:hypothetical protein
MKKWPVKILYRVGVVVLMVGLLWWEFHNKEKLPELWTSFRLQMLEAWPGWFWMALLLMPVNWFCEVMKWQPLMRQYEDISKATAFKAVFAGVSVSLFTPNRVGEFGGRMLFVAPENRWKAIIINFVGNLCQLLVLLTAGVIGIIWLMHRLLLVEERLIYAFFTVSIIGLVLIYLLYFNVGLVLPVARRIPLLQRLKPYVRDVGILSQLEARTLWHILGWTALRYTIYSTQYWLLLRFFHIQADFWSAYAGIAAIFLLQSSIPLPPVAGLAARGGLAIWVWAYFGANEISSLSSTFALWCINLILAALIGAVFLLQIDPVSDKK